MQYVMDACAEPVAPMYGLVPDGICHACCQHRSVTPTVDDVISACRLEDPPSALCGLHFKDLHSMLLLPLLGSVCPWWHCCGPQLLSSPHTTVSGLVNS